MPQPSAFAVAFRLKTDPVHAQRYAEQSGMDLAFARFQLGLTAKYLEESARNRDERAVKRVMAELQADGYL